MLIAMHVCVNVSMVEWMYMFVCVCVWVSGVDRSIAIHKAACGGERKDLN